MVFVPATVYDPKRIVAAYGVVPLVGFASGRFTTIRRDAPTWRTVHGTNGEMKRVRTRTKSGTIEFVFRGTAPINRLLSILAQSDERSGGIFQTITVGDTLNGGLFVGRNAYIEQYPEKMYGTNETDTSWRFRCEDMKLTFPGASLETVGIRVFGEGLL